MPDSLVSMGPVFWYLSRAFGITAYVALTLEILLGLSASTGLLDRTLGRARVIELHRWLSIIAIGTLAAHALVLLGDKTVPLSVAALLVPFTTEYRPFAVGLGVLGAYIAVIVHVSFWLRKAIGARTWRKLHYLSFALFAFATLHGLLAGTDASAPAMVGLYVVSTSLVMALIFYQILRVLIPGSPLRAPQQAGLASPGAGSSANVGSPGR